MFDLGLGNVSLDSGHAIAAYSFCRLQHYFCAHCRTEVPTLVKTYSCSGSAQLAVLKCQPTMRDTEMCSESIDAETVRGTVPGLELQDECSAEPSIWKAL